MTERSCFLALLPLRANPSISQTSEELGARPCTVGGEDGEGGRVGGVGVGGLDLRNGEPEREAKQEVGVFHAPSGGSPVVMTL